MSGIINNTKARSGNNSRNSTIVTRHGTGTLQFKFDPRCKTVDINLQGAGSGAQGAWAGSQGGFSGGFAGAYGISTSQFTVAERGGETAITVVVGSRGVTNGAHNGTDNGANASNFGNYIAVNGCNAVNDVISNVTTNLSGVHATQGHSGSPGGQSLAPTTGGGIFGGGQHGAGAGGGPPGGGGGGNGVGGVCIITQHLE